MVPHSQHHPRPPTTAHARPTTSPLLRRPCSHLPARAPSSCSLTLSRRAWTCPYLRTLVVPPVPAPCSRSPALTPARSARTCPFLSSALTTTCSSMAVQRSPLTISHRHCRHCLMVTGSAHANPSASGADGGERVCMSQGVTEAKGSTAGVGRGASRVRARARAMGGRLARGTRTRV